jgi:hypothetical protein
MTKLTNQSISHFEAHWSAVSYLVNGVTADTADHNKSYLKVEYLGEYESI